MEVIVKSRGEGKTTELIKLAAAKGYYMIVKGHVLARYTAEKAREMGLDIPFPLTFKEFLGGHYYQGKSIPGFLIDDAELLLMELANRGVPIVAITVSPGENY